MSLQAFHNKRVSALTFDTSLVYVCGVLLSVIALPINFENETSDVSQILLLQARAVMIFLMMTASVTYL